MTLRTVVVMTENFPKQQSWMIFLDQKGQSSSLKILENASESIGIRTNRTSIDRLDHPPNGPLIAQGDGEANGFVERSGDAAASAHRWGCWGFWGMALPPSREFIHFWKKRVVVFWSWYEYVKLWFSMDFKRCHWCEIKLQGLVLWVKIGVLTPWTFHPFSNLVCYLVALKGSVVYPLSPIFLGCLVLSNFSQAMFCCQEAGGRGDFITGRELASWIQNYCSPRFFFFSGVLIMISVFFSWPWNCGIYPNLPGESGSCWWNLWKPNGGYLPSMAIEIGEHSCRRKTDGICMNVLLPKLVFFFCVFF